MINVIKKVSRSTPLVYMSCCFDSQCRCWFCLCDAVHIIGRHDGRTFDDRDVNFVVGEASEAGVIDGIDQAIKKFKKGERSILKVKAKYAYGAVGCEEHNIPANADLEYEVELKKFEKVMVIFHEK